MDEAPRRSTWVLERGDPGFPACLLSTPDPPKRLFGMGDPQLLGAGLAVVGSRRASSYGLACARAFAGCAAEWGVLVVSGGAAGCDSAAHVAALERGRPTVTVLGCGPDVDYPPSSSGMLARIRECGCVVSELPPGTVPKRWAFPRRNRIIAGLARAVLIVEAGLPSGTFSTADHALEAGREVFAVPGSVHAPGSAGTNRLIRQGATPIACVDDLLDSLAPLFPLTTVAATDQPGDPVSSDPVLDLLLVEPRSADALAAELAVPLRDVLCSLSELEVSGLANRDADGRFSPSIRALEGGL